MSIEKLKDAGIGITINKFGSLKITVDGMTKILLNRQAALQLTDELYDLLNNTNNEQAEKTQVTMELKMDNSPIAELNTITNGVVRQLIERMKTDSEFRESIKNNILDKG